MATEVKNVETMMTYANYRNWLYLFAKAVSESSNFNIIDSNATTAGRYVGDPIADNVWTSELSINSGSSYIDGCWIVIESQDTIWPALGLPKWQMLVAPWSSSSGFVDPSGHDYGFVGTGRRVCWRFAPFGGWDLAGSSPDFAGPLGELSFPHTLFYLENAGAGDTFYSTFLFHPGGIQAFTRRVLTVGGLGNDRLPVIWGGYIGDFRPVDVTQQTMPRLALGNGYNQYVNNVPLFTSHLGQCTLRCYNNLGAIATFAGTADLSTVGSKMLGIDTQPSRFAPNKLEYDLIPCLLSAAGLGMIGEMPYTKLSRGPGIMKLAPGDYLSLGHGAQNGISFAVAWDPAVDYR